MARTTIRIPAADLQAANQMITAILSGNGYRIKEEKGETVWKNGTGFWTAMKYIKVEFSESGEVVLHAWVRPTLGSEMGLDGFVGCIPKKQVTKVINKIKAALA